MTYWFVLFACIFFTIFWFVKIPSFRKIWILIGSMIFHYQFAGPAGVTPIIILGLITYLSGLSKIKSLRIFAIVLCVAALAFYKYTSFLIAQVLGIFDKSLADALLANVKKGLLPDAPPLAISFFVFEFVHYLVDVQRGKQPIRSVTDFTLFSIFWPSVVSGPVKRYEQFLPSLVKGCQNVNSNDIQIGIMRIVMGLTKKLVIADNLTNYISFWQPFYHTLPIEKRWLIFLAISFRILFDFSGYSDIAIGFARLMGIRLPENFRWPYLATNLQEFWQRWHISLSTWIRDYIYIPLGGNKYGNLRKFSNGMIAFTICGLWHGAAYNFIIWGIYHGFGLLLFAKIKSLSEQLSPKLSSNIAILPFAWFFTFMFVSIGWLYFFYSIKEANQMVLSLFS